MARYLSFECPTCLTVFRFFQHPSNEPLPENCPVCEVRGVIPVFEPAAPHLGKTIGRTADQVYRQTEAASVAAAEMAATVGGGDASDYAAMRVTNMADYLRPGDIAAKMSDNPVAQVMANSGQGGFQPLGGMSGADYAAGTSQGAFPRRGEATRQALVQGHQQLARVVEGQGRIRR